MTRLLNSRYALFIFAAIILLLLFAMRTANAAYTSVVIRWTPPTQYDDNTSIARALTYNVYQGAKGAAKTTRIASGITGTQYTLTGAALGPCFDMTAVDGPAESLHTTEVCLAAVPKTPTALVIVSGS